MPDDPHDKPSPQHNKPHPQASPAPTTPKGSTPTRTPTDHDKTETGSEPRRGGLIGLAERLQFIAISARGVAKAVTQMHETVSQVSQVQAILDQSDAKLQKLLASAVFYKDYVDRTFGNPAFMHSRGFAFTQLYRVLAELRRALGPGRSHLYDELLRSAMGFEENYRRGLLK